MHRTHTDAFTMEIILCTVLNSLKQQKNGDGTSMSFSVTGKLILPLNQPGYTGKADQTQTRGSRGSPGSVAACGQPRWFAELSFLQQLGEAKLACFSEGGLVPSGHCPWPERRVSCCDQFCDPGPNAFWPEAQGRGTGLAPRLKPLAILPQVWTAKWRDFKSVCISG